MGVLLVFLAFVLVAWLSAKSIPKSKAMIKESNRKHREFAKKCQEFRGRMKEVEEEWKDLSL